MAPKVSSCGTLYFMCTPSTTVMVAPTEAPAFQKHSKRRREDAAPAAAAAAPFATVPDAPGAAASPGDGAAATCDAREAGGDSSMDGEAEEMAVDGDGASDEEVEAGGGVAVHAGASHAVAPAQAAAGGVAPTAEEAAAQRVVTIIVPVSISTAAPTPDRLHQLLALSDVEGGAPVSMALVDSDCTCIVSNIYRGMVPPPALDVVDGVADDDDDLPAPVQAAQELQVEGDAEAAQAVEQGDAQEEPFELS